MSQEEEALALAGMGSRGGVAVPVGHLLPAGLRLRE